MMRIDREGKRKIADIQDSIEALNPASFQQYQLAMELFVDLARNMDAKPIIMTQARLVSGKSVLSPEKRKRVDYHYVGLSHEALIQTFDRLDEIVRNVSDSKDAMLIDASAHLSGIQSFFDDHVHVLPQGSDALAQLVADQLKGVLRK